MTPTRRLIGRVAELDTLMRAASFVPDGHGRAHLLSGAAGLGKTALLAQLQADVGLTPLIVRPEADSAAAPLQPWSNALHLWALRCGLAPERPPEQVLDVVSMVHRSAAATPLVIVMDDAESLDDMALGVVDLLLDDLERLPIMIVAAFRTASDVRSSSWRTFDRWRNDLRFVETELAPLPPADLRRIVRRRLGEDLLGPELERVADGNPLLALELCRAAAGMGKESADLDQLIDRRRPAGPSRVALDVLALLGRPAAAGWIAAASGRSVVEIADELAGAAAHGLVDWTRRIEDPASITHGLLEDSVLRSMAGAERCRLHTRIAELLLSEGEGQSAADCSIEAAEHALRSGVGGSLVVETGLRAAARCEADGRLEAARCFVERVLEAGPSCTRRLDALHLLARLTGRLGDLDRAGALFDEVFTAAEREGDHVRAGSSLLDHCVVDPQLMAGSERRSRRLERTASLVGDEHPQLRIGLLSRLAETLFLGDPDASLAAAERAVGLIDERTESSHSATALVNLAVVLPTEPGAIRIRRLRDRLRALEDPLAELYATIPDALVCLQTGSRLDLDATYRAHRAAIERHPVGYYLAGGHLLQADMALCDADVPALRNASASVLRDAGGLGAGMALMLLPLELAWRFHSGSSLDLDFSQIPPMPMAAGFTDLLVLGYTVVDAAHGDGSALDRLPTLLRPVATVHRNFSWATWMALLSVGGAMAGRPDIALDAAEALSPMSEEWAVIGTHALIGPMGYFAADGFAAAGRIEEAARCARAGLAAAQRLASVQWTIAGAAQVLVTDPDIGEAERTALTSMATTMLARHGVRIRPRDAAVLRPRVSTLREREQRILELAAAGHSNRQIAQLISVSEKTVERTFTEIFRRTGTTNRAGAVAHHLTGTADRLVS